MYLISEMLTRASLDCPTKEAVICGNRRFTYLELENSSNKLANFMVSQGLGYRDRIGIFSNKCIEEIIAIFAILKVGAIFVHINPQFRESQLSHLISDCKLKLLFISKSKNVVFNKALNANSSISHIISFSQDIELDSTVFKNIHFFNNILKEVSGKEAVCEGINENDTASIIYTSGSTGRPKGIIVTHKIFHDATITSAAVLENNSDDRLISASPFSFDGALSQLFTSILVGGTLVLQQSMFPTDIVRTLIDERITGFHAVPTLWIMLLQKYSSFEKHNYPHLRYISIIGEVFPQKYFVKLKKILHKTKIFMMYGTTEAFRSTYLSPEDLKYKPLSVGKAFPNVKISIVDEENHVCNAGEIGEIVHSGAFVSPGYWNDPQKTRETFRENSVYTGDLGKLDSDGFLYFVGRKDSMIKTAGYRVSPEEIEECLYEMEEIEEAAVIGVENEKIGNSIKAVIVCKPNKTIASAGVINHCRARLPSYMVPREIDFVSSLPKTASNKINRSELIKKQRGF